MHGAQLEDLGRIETAARRHDLAGGLRRVGQDVQPEPCDIGAAWSTPSPGPIWSTSAK